MALQLVMIELILTRRMVIRGNIVALIRMNGLGKVGFSKHGIDHASLRHRGHGFDGRRWWQ